MPVPKSLDRCKINVGQSLEIRPVCLKYLRKTKIHGEHSQKISPVYLTANSWGTIPKIVPVFIQILNSLIYYGCLSIYCHSPFALIPVAIQDRSMFCYSYLLRFRIAYCWFEIMCFLPAPTAMFSRHPAHTRQWPVGRCAQSAEGSHFGSPSLFQPVHPLKYR